MNVDKLLKEIRYVTDNNIELPDEIISEDDIEWYVKGYTDAMCNISLSISTHKFHWQRNWMSYSWGHENYHTKSITQKEYFI